MNNPEIIVKNAPFKHFCMSIGAIPTSYLNSLDYYETLLWLIKYLEETIIPTVNNNGEAVSELQTLYIQLKDFVENYFANLDVQEEINNKLDDMAESGELTDIIAQYLGLSGIIAFNNVSELKNAENIVNGSKCMTLGYYNVNDGGTAYYKIRTITNEDTVDEGFIIALKDNTLIAELIIDNNTVNIKQLGAKSQDKENNKYDIKPYVEKYISYLSKSKELKLYIPGGIWTTSPLTLNNSDGFYIFGDERFSFSDKDLGTNIIAIDNQSHILQIGDNDNTVQGWVLKNINFSSRNYIYNDGSFIRDDYNSISDACLVLIHADFGISDNLFFNWIDGSALRITSSWENYFNLLNFRGINGIEKGIVIFDEIISTGDNITATNFNKIMFESVTGDLFVAKENCILTNSSINTLNFEAWAFTYPGYSYTTITDESEEDLTPWAIFKTYGRCELNINNLELNVFGYRYLNYNDLKYCYNTIINVAQDNSQPNMCFNNINTTTMKFDCPIIRQNNYYLHNKSSVNVNNITFSGTDNKFYFYTTGAKRIGFNGLTLDGNSIANSVTSFYGPKYTDIIPAYKQANFYNNKNFGTLHYDQDCINDLKQAVIPYNTNDDYTTSSLTGVITNGNLLFRAKVAEGETAYLTMFIGDYNTSQTLQFIGTGDYEIYKKENLSNISDNIGKPFSMRTGNGGIGVNLSIDYFIFY